MVPSTMTISRRRLVQVGGLLTIGLLAACTSAAQPTPTAAPRPTAPPKPTAAQAQPTAAKPQPTAAPATKPTQAPTVRTFTPAAVKVTTTTSTKAKAVSELFGTQGFYKQFGLTANTMTMNTDNLNLTAISTGEADISVHSGFDPVFAAIAQGATLKFVAGSTMKPSFAVYSGNPSVKTIKDLEGKTVGGSPPGTLIPMMMLALFKKYEVDASKVTFVTIGISTDVYKAVVARKVDAGASGIDYIPTMAKEGVTVISEIWKDLPDYAITASYVSLQGISEKRDVLVRTLAAWGQAFRFLSRPESQDAYVAAYKNQGGNEEEGKFSWQWHRDNKAWATDLVVSEQQLAFLQQVRTGAGVQEAPLPYDKLTDMSLARDALKLMT